MLDFSLEHLIIFGIDCLFSIVFLIIILFLTLPSIKKTSYLLFLVITTILSLISGFFNLNGLRLVLLFFCITTVFAYIITNETEFKRLLSAPRRKKRRVKDYEKDRSNIIRKMRDLVFDLSASKTGAIITFLKNDSLDKYIANGVIIDAPVSVKLLQTIFYVGTPLHDGAVIIRDNIIEAAAVFYTPSTKPLPGKYGARHRAAIGISEETDSVTLVVSEETGRVSLTYRGSLFPINKENFLMTILEYLNK